MPEEQMTPYESTLLELLQRDERIVILTAENRAALRNLPPLAGERFLDVGIAEQTLIGVAAGMALRGRIPIAHALAAFLTMRAFEFIRTDVGIARLPVKLVGGFPGFLSEGNGPTHQSLEDIALMRSIPGMGIFCPADEAELVLGLPSVVMAPQPFYIRYPNVPAAVEHTQEFALGKAERFGDPESPIAIFVYGFLLREVLEAQEILASHGIGACVYNLRTVVPLDEEALLNATLHARLLVTVEDHFRHGGIATMVAEFLTERRLALPVLPIAVPSRWVAAAPLAELLRHEGFTGEQIAERILAALPALGV
jgi:transketolase